MNILWIGPWRADALSTQVRGSMARALHNTGNFVATIVFGEQGSWRTGGYDRIIYCSIPQSLFGKFRNQIQICSEIIGFHGNALVLGEKVAHLALVAAVARIVLRRNWCIFIDIRTLPIPSTARFPAISGRNRFWRQLQIGMPYADAWMAITPSLREVVRKRIVKRDLPCLVWESAVDARFLDSQGSSDIADRIKRCGHEVNVLYLGSLARGRRIDLAIRAMTELSNESDRVGLHIVGSGDHVPELKALVLELDLTNTVHIWDPVPYEQVPSTILACDLGILPLPDCDAWNTSSALKLYEYMGMGRPVLVSNIMAHNYAIGGRPFAFFMRDYTTDGYIEALQRFLDLRKEAREELGILAKEFVRDNHTYDHRAKSIHEFMIRVLESRG